MLWLIKGLDVKTVAHAMLVQIVNLGARLVPFITCPRPSSFIHCKLILWLKLFETCEIEDPFPILTSMHDGSHVVLCLGSELCNKTCRSLDPSGPKCWFLSLGELGFEALTSLVGCPRCLVLTVDISPLVSRRVSAKTWSNMSTMITCIMCYMLYTEKCKPSNKNANCVFRQLKNYYEMKLWKA